MKRSPITNRLKRLGAVVHIGHKAAHVGDADVVVVSSAIKPNNPEVQAAKKQAIPVVQRAEMLAEIMRLVKYGIAVAGTHGKTTTTSLLATILQTAKLDPTAIIGGRVKSLRSNAKLGRGDFMVTEADESDGSFLKLYPTVAVVTNIDHEHLDHYGTFQKCRDAFMKFCQRVPFHGLSVLCGEDGETLALGKKISGRHVFYGFSPEHDWNARHCEFRGTMSRYQLFRRDEFVDQIELNLSGRHNVLNSLAAIAAAVEIGVSLKDVKKALKNFGGVERRMQVLFKGNDLVVLDDYGHHPTEIQATVNTIRQAFMGRLVVLFQPHRYSRTRDLFQDFVKSFDGVDQLFIMDIYAASESPLRGVHAKKLVEAVAQRSKIVGRGSAKNQEVFYAGKTDNIVETICDELKPGDVFLSLGAGDVTKMGQKIAKVLKGKQR